MDEIKQGKLPIKKIKNDSSQFWKNFFTKTNNMKSSGIDHTHEEIKTQIEEIT